MVLLADIGNSEMRFAVSDKDKIIMDVFLSSRGGKTSHEILASLLVLMESEGTDRKLIEGGILSSVVPSLTEHAAEAMRLLLLKAPLIVGPGIKTGLDIRTDNPRELGSDRIVNAVAAYKEHPGSLIIIDFGNATTLCHMDKKGVYRGGVILPGMVPSGNSLFSSCEKIPVTEGQKTGKIIAGNTRDSVKSGLWHSYRIMTEGMIREIKDEINREYGETPLVIATGRGVPPEGFSWEGIDIFDPDLTLKGLKLIYDKNK